MRGHEGNLHAGHTARRPLNVEIGVTSEDTPACYTPPAMPPRRLLAACLIASATATAVLVLILLQPSDSGEPRQITDEPAMTLDGVIALVSREQIGCPEQPLLVLTADATYDGDGKWTVTYGDYSWSVDEANRAVRALGDPLPCPQR